MISISLAVLSCLFLLTSAADKEASFFLIRTLDKNPSKEEIDN
jgi:hypothetical protein